MRRADREVTDINDIRQILDEGEVLHIALNNGVYPYILPVNYGYELSGGRLTLFSTARLRVQSTPLSQRTTTSPSR